MFNVQSITDDNEKDDKLSEIGEAGDKAVKAADSGAGADGGVDFPTQDVDVENVVSLEKILVR